MKEENKLRLDGVKLTFSYYFPSGREVKIGAEIDKAGIWHQWILEENGGIVEDLIQNDELMGDIAEAIRKHLEE